MPKKQQPDPVSSLLSEFGARLNEMEEKQRLIKDRLLLIGENLISAKEEFDKDSLEFKKKNNEMGMEIKELKRINTRILHEMGNVARKEELKLIKKQAEIFEPLKFTTKKEVEKLIDKRLKNYKKQEN